jgi:hypothetical protein
MVADDCENEADAVRTALAEIQHLRAEVAAAEQRGAQRERAAVVAWLRNGAHGFPLDPLISDAIESGEHVEVKRDAT